MYDVDHTATYLMEIYGTLMRYFILKKEDSIIEGSVGIKGLALENAKK